MRVFGRNDSWLAGALIVATFILFREPFHYLLSTAHEIERQYHVDLVQSLAVLGVVFAFHQYRKRQEAKADFIGAAAEARQARLRSQELERLVGLSRALAMAKDFTGLHQAFTRYLPQLTGERASWLLICHEGCWDVLVRGADDQRLPGALEAIAERALRAGMIHPGADDAIRVEGVVCFPMLVGVHPVGIMLVEDGPVLTPHECRALDAAAALAAISVRNVQTLLATRDHSLRDGLTGCFNRAHALETIDGELRRARRSATPLSMIMFDLDGFKGVNDSYGHLAGDRLLAEVGRRLADVLRTSDVKCRYGGDEFLLILPDTTAAGARQLAESIRQQISRLVVSVDDVSVAVTTSLGVVTADGEAMDVLAFIARADAALYRAKHEGRNRVHVDEGAAAVPMRLVSAAG
jgi:diguanylate cyclase (GGDEF)-like protein